VNAQVNVDLTASGNRLLMVAVMSPVRDVCVLRALLVLTPRALLI
jgi:hypothetical protein